MPTDLLTVKEAAARVRISPSLVYELCRLRLVKHTRHGRPGSRGTIRITEEALKEYLAGCEKEGEEVDDGPLKFIR